MKIGIVGLPNVGKSTLFAALTRKKVDINNYPFCTIDPNVGVVEVPDERLEKLSQMSQSEKTVPAAVEFVDIAGLVKGASAGEGLGNKFLANIREVDAIVQVVRVFANDTITHVSDSIDPERDVETIQTELILADLATVEKAVNRLQKVARTGDRNAAAQLSAAEKIRETLNAGELARQADLDESDPNVAIVKQQMSLLTFKPMLYLYNMIEGDKLSERLQSLPHVALDIKLEEELRQMSAAEAAELGIDSRLDDLIKAAYDLLELITFFTTGKKETRAWTIKKGSTAPEAGKAIHSDFRDKFIRAEAVFWEDLLSAGSYAAAREAGKVSIVGKDYIVRDGDVLEFFI